MARWDMTTYRAMSVIPSLTGLPEDAVSNTFWVRDPAGVTLDATTAAEVGAHIAAFYNAAGSGGNDLSRYMSGELSRVANAAKVKVYGSLAPTPGSPPPAAFGGPLAEVSWTLTAAADPAALPSEVAAVLSCKSGDLVQTGSTRGRVFIGPLNNSTNTTAAGTPSRPATAFLAEMRSQAQDLQNNLLANSPSLQWGVWGKQGWYTYAYVWTDNAWDTQRRRGVASTAKVIEAL